MVFYSSTSKAQVTRLMNRIIQPLASYRDLYAFGKKLSIDLSLSENPLGCSPKVIRALKAASFKDCFDYPDPDSTELSSALVKKLNVKKESLFIANGSESIIKLLPQALLKPGDEVIIPELTFPMFAKAVKLAGGQVVLSKMTKDLDIDLADIEKRLTSKTRMIFLCNPNNPTGRVIGKKDTVSFTKRVEALVVVDEANIEFGGETVISQVGRLTNLIVLRTFSKGFGLAGLRIGFCVANPDIILILKKTSQPFPISSLSQKAAVEALRDRQFMAKTKNFMRKERMFLTKELLKRGFKVVGSNANNLLVRTSPLFSSSDRLIDEFNQRNVSVVNGANFGSLGQNFIRVSPRSRKTNRKFLMVIDEILKIGNSLEL